MRRVRALDKDSGQFLKTIHASTVTEESRYAHDYCCMDPECGARFHWRKETVKRENTKTLPPTFVRNASTSHKKGCAYDYEYKARHNSGLTFYEDGFYHLRINFPLGGAWEDRNMAQSALTGEQRRVAKGRSHYKGLSDMRSVVAFLEKEFGSLESPALENLVLHYQGHDYKWTDMFVRADDYKRSFNAAAQNAADDYRTRQRQIMVVKPLKTLPKNSKGKWRFGCEVQAADTYGKKRNIQPILVVDNSFAATLIDEIMRDKGVMLMAAAPFIPPSALEEKRSGPKAQTPCYYNIIKPSQFARINPRYWRYHPARDNEDLFDWGARKSGKVSRGGPQ